LKDASHPKFKDAQKLIRNPTVGSGLLEIWYTMTSLKQ
jgi:hypothetical protein